MIGEILVTLLVAAIVVGYMTIVNRMLHSDKHWSESNQVKPVAITAVPAFHCATASPAHA